MMWTLNEARELATKLNERVWEYNWHVCLGGSVLHKGFSEKDLDLYVMPVKEETPHDLAHLGMIIHDLFGGQSEELEQYSCICYQSMRKYWYGDKRIDVFVGRSALETQIELSK